jgi:hypothetical protein
MLGMPSSDQRAARVAHVLSRAVRDSEVPEADALRILRHELRRRETKQSQSIPTRSVQAQAVIDKYGAENVPKNASSDALHSDHVYPLTEEAVRTTTSVDDWVAALEQLRTVVCVTAAENYALERLERQGSTGPEKYALAGVEFTTDALPWSD